VTHLVVNWRELERLAPDYPVTPWADEDGRQHWRLLLGALGPPVLDVAGVTVHPVGRCAASAGSVPGV
jgi:hypothetical protein